MINIVTPHQYLNEPGALAKAGELVAPIAKRVFIVGSPTALAVAGPLLFESLDRAGVSHREREYSGYPTKEAAAEIARAAAEFSAAALVAVGGGRVMDTVKAAGTYAELPVIAVPTIAATCACWAPVAVLYDSEGVMREPLHNKNAPLLIIVDTALLAAAPVRYIRSGIADTLAKWYESIPNLHGSNDFYLRLVVRYGEMCRDILEDLGIKVANGLEKGVYTAEELIEVLDCIFLLAGLCGAIKTIVDTQGIAHPFYNAASVIPELRTRLHGEKVGFGLVVQAILEKGPDAEIEHRVAVFAALKIPLTLEELGLEPDFDAKMTAIIAVLKKTTPTYAGIDKPWTDGELRDAVKTASRLVTEYRKNPPSSINQTDAST